MCRGRRKLSGLEGIPELKNGGLKHHVHEKRSRESEFSCIMPIMDRKFLEPWGKLGQKSPLKRELLSNSPRNKIPVLRPRPSATFPLHSLLWYSTFLSSHLDRTQKVAESSCSVLLMKGQSTKHHSAYLGPDPVKQPNNQPTPLAGRRVHKTGQWRRRGRRRRSAWL